MFSGRRNRCKPGTSFADSRGAVCIAAGRRPHGGALHGPGRAATGKFLRQLCLRLHSGCCAFGSHCAWLPLRRGLSDAHTRPQDRLSGEAGQALRMGAAGMARYLLAASTLGDVPASAAAPALDGACLPSATSFLAAHGERHLARGRLAEHWLAAEPPGAPQNCGLVCCQFNLALLGPVCGHS